MTADPAARDDAALVAGALAGESRAFTEIMRRHKEAIYRFVRRYVGDGDEAYDLVQETFLSAWTALSSFDTGKSLSVWLRRIALNKCRDWSRRRQVRSFFFGAKSINASAIDVAQPPAVAGDDGRMAALDASIAALPRSLKEPLLLTAFEGLSHKEAAVVLNVSPKAIETRVYRAKQRLGRDLGLPAANDD
jgi:RNA polymerase sigma-70 factor (ECF subfamily)